jgi:hypothetical protein
MTTETATTYVRVIYYRDDSGRLCSSRIESTDPAEVVRWSAVMARLERASADSEKRWRVHHATFTDASLQPDRVTKTVQGRPSQGGYPWEGPRYDFALLLGGSPTWSGPESLWLWHSGRKRWVCRFCGHYGARLPLVAYCLACDRSGRDLVIPKGKRRTEAKEPKDDGLKGGVG